MPRSSGITSVANQAANVGIDKKKADLKRPSRRKYTDKEKKRLSKLRGKNNYYRKRIAKLLHNDTEKITMSMVRDSLDINDSTHPLYKYLQPEEDYYNRDLIEWMTSEGDEDLIPMVIQAYNDIHPGANLDLSEDNGWIKKENIEKAAEYNDYIEANNKRINFIKENAEQRKNEEMLKYLQDKQSIKDTKNLMQAISQGKISLDKLSDPELSAVRFMKTELIKAVYSQIDFDSIPESYVPVIKRSIYAGIMEDPIQGMRDALKGTVALKVAEKYGNNAADLAGGMMDFATSVMTGKPNVKSAAKSLFNYMVNKSPMNKALMSDVAQELINSGESTSDEENAKMLGRDVLVDIGKNLITTGGNIFAAMPGIIRDIAVDAGQATVRKIKSDSDDAKKKEKKKEEAIKKAEQKSGNIDMDAILAKFQS